jgi:hypothetical protein
MSFIKFGISYNVFDGEELLKDSIIQIRDVVEHISVVYQTQSYWGNNCSINLYDDLSKLKKDGYVDEIIEYKNNFNFGPHVNETNKRNLGIESSKKSRCTHHMSMDCDEFYTTGQFIDLLNWYEENQNYVGFCKYLDYYKSPSFIIDKPNEKTRVSLFFPIKNNEQFVLGYNSPVLVDPTRRPNYDNYIEFDSNFIQMHHMTFVRKDIRSKILNSPKRLNYNDLNKINEIIDYYNNWDENKINGLNEEGFLNLKKVDSLFILENYNIL